MSMTDPRSERMDGIIGYWRTNGEFMPLIAGGSPEGDDGEDETMDETQTQEEEDTEDDEEEQEIDPATAVEKAKAEIDKNKRLGRKLRKAEKDLQAAQAAIKSKDDEKKTESEKAIEAAAEANKRADDAEAKLKRSEIRERILDHDDVSQLSKGQRKQILRLIDFEDVEVDEDDDDNIDDLLGDLKKEMPVLFDTEQEEEETSSDGDRPPKRTASPPKRRKTNAESDHAALVQRMPHLAKHV